MTTLNTIRTKALKWWRLLGDSEQQRLADKYYPKDDFILTDCSSNRIEKIYKQENAKQKV